VKADSLVLLDVSIKKVILNISTVAKLLSECTASCQKCHLEQGGWCDYGNSREKLPESRLQTPHTEIQPRCAPEHFLLSQ
ncbi:unnamed protein product, partial [Pleuronectes platessa]